MSSGEDKLLRQLKDLDGIIHRKAAALIEALQASNLRLSGMCYDLAAERNRLQAQVRFLERKAVESAKKA